MHVVNLAVQRPPVQQAVRPIEPGVVKNVQCGHRRNHVQHLHVQQEQGSEVPGFGLCSRSRLAPKALPPPLLLCLAAITRPIPQAPNNTNHPPPSQHTNTRKIKGECSPGQQHRGEQQPLPCAHLQASEWARCRAWCTPPRAASPPP